MKNRRVRELTVANKQARLDCSRLLLRSYPASLVHFIWFTDEKLFTDASLSNTQNDRLYLAVGTPKRDITADRLSRTRPMMSVGFSSLGRTSIHFVDPGVKIKTFSLKFENSLNFTFSSKMVLQRTEVEKCTSDE